MAGDLSTKAVSVIDVMNCRREGSLPSQPLVVPGEVHPLSDVCVGSDALARLVCWVRQAVAGCDAVSITVADASGAGTVAATGADARVVDAAQYAAQDGPCLRVARGGPAVQLAEITAQRRWPAFRTAAQETGFRSSAALPLRANGLCVGSLNLYARRSGALPPLETDSLVAAADLAATVLKMQRGWETERSARMAARQAAHDVQRSLLPTLPTVPSLRIAARYRPSSGQIGGDWYDVLKLPDGVIGLAIGDVMGHDLTAAAAMGQLRSVLRSYAWEGHSPSGVLERLDRLVQALDMADLATAIYGRLVLGADDATLRYANAGHLPPLLLDPGGGVHELDGAHGILIGTPVTAIRPWDEAGVTLPVGGTLLFYTDGLVEHRHRSLDQGLAALRETAARHRAADGPAALCDRLLSALVSDDTDDPDDDIALLAVQLDPPGGPAADQNTKPSTLHP
ncbi:GAF domain-containing SpoIIE family protein phosphatase [Parafrankia sp. FMc6]|uniref:PP2C family protein-serine/threonine phosphatase n=1 Tax=Parafrankia soli TaxID=2599596 RepID=UPI0034D4A75D